MPTIQRLAGMFALVGFLTLAAEAPARDLRVRSVNGRLWVSAAEASVAQIVREIGRTTGLAVWVAPDAESGLAARLVSVDLKDMDLTTAVTVLLRDVPHHVHRGASGRPDAILVGRSARSGSLEEARARIESSRKKPAAR